MLSLASLGTGAAAGGGGTALSSILPFAGAAIGAKNFIGNGHYTADNYVRTFQEPFNKELARLSAAGDMDGIERLVQGFQSTNQQLMDSIPAAGKTQMANIISQAMSSIMPTITQMRLQSGRDPNTGQAPAQVPAGQPTAPVDTSGPATTDASGQTTVPGQSTTVTAPAPDPTQTTGNSSLKDALLKYGIPAATVGILLSKIGAGDTAAGSGNPGTGAGFPTPATGVDTSGVTAPSASGRGGLLSQLLPYILTGTSIGSQLYGANQATNAANKAAEANAAATKYATDASSKAASDTLAFQQKMFDTNQANQAPYLKTGTNALYALNNLMGLPVQANAPYATPAVRPR